MATQIHPEKIFFSTVAQITYGGVDVGASQDPPQVNIDETINRPDYQQAGGPVKGTASVDQVLVSAEFSVDEFTAAMLASVMPGAQVTDTPSVGQPVAGLATTLAADPALGATNVKVTSVTTVVVDDFVRIGPASPTEQTSEVVRVLTVGTTGSGGTGLDVVSDVGGGLAIDHANAEEIKTVTGTELAAPAAVGATNLKLVGVTGLIVGDFLRVGYAGHYETRELTAVGTAGAGGTGVTFAQGLTRDHAVGEWAIEVTSLGSSRIGWRIGRVPSGAYKDCILTGLGLDGQPLVVTIKDAINEANQAIAFAKGKGTSLKCKMVGYYSPTDPTLVPILIEI